MDDWTYIYIYIYDLHESMPALIEALQLQNLLRPACSRLGLEQGFVLVTRCGLVTW